MCLVRVLVGLRRMLVRLGRVLMSGGLVALAMVFRRRTMRFCGVLVMLGCFRMGGLGHKESPDLLD